MIVPRNVPPELRWFEEARFGMFIHFGLYALLGRGEWVMYHESIPRAEYEKLARRFDPRRFDADAWVGLAQDAGARYITCTAKHHDGFCLFDSALTDYKITRTPFKRDLIGELADACHRAGMRLIFYYSQPDWHHPNYVHQRGAFKDLDDPPATDEPDWDRYVAYYIGQVRELCTNYGRIDGIWFDGSHKSEQEWRGRQVYRMIKRLQPDAVVNDRARHGDFFTPERRLPDDLTGYMFEACQSVSPQAWGYRAASALYGAPYLVRSLVRMASSGGNYLLNVGPAPDGAVPHDQAGRMRAVGRWLRTHGEAVYHTQACALPLPPEELRATRRGKTVYVHLLQWPDTDRFPLSGVQTKPSRAEMIGTRAKLSICEGDRGLEVAGLPATPPDGLPAVVKLTFRSTPKLRLAKAVVPRPPSVVLKATGATVLPVASAELRGRGVKGALLRRVTDPGTGNHVAGWLTPDQKIAWSIDVQKAGDYAVSVDISCPPEWTDCEVVVRVSAQTVRAQLRPTAGLGDYRRRRIGLVHLPKGRPRLTLWPGRLHWSHRFGNVRSVVLTPS